MKKFKRMQFITHGDKAVSTSIQNHLFSLGYGWGGAGRDQTVQMTGFGSVTTHLDGRICWRDVDAIPDGEVINIDWMFAPKVESVKIGGKLYNKADVDERLKELKPL